MSKFINCVIPVVTSMQYQKQHTVSFAKKHSKTFYTSFNYTNLIGVVLFGGKKPFKN
jgi:hypothetical protein